ncbi:MAG: CoA transferase [Hyphomicrobiaceae bacterium]
MTEPLPLAGRIIVEHVAAGSSEVEAWAIALAGRIAADLGATVVRAGDSKDDARRWGAAADHFLNQGKHSQPTGRPADAVLTNTGALPAALAATPIKILVGHGVPPSLGLAEADVTDAVILALSGLLDLIGHPDAAPVPFGGRQAAGVAGLAAFAGLMAAMAAGQPDTVHISALEACLWSNWKSYAERLYMNRTPTRQGALSEWQAIPCADGYATLVFLEKDWPAVCRLIGDPRLSRPPLDTQAGRRADMAAVYAIVRPWYANRTRAEIYRLARAEGLPISPVLTVAEVIDDPQYAAQAFFAPVRHTAAPSARVPTIPTVWNGSRFPPRPVGDTAPMPKPATVARASRPPLVGTRVLDLGIITAGASTSALLADLGADVIKVEASAYIDPFRVWDRGLGAPDWWNRSRFFDFTNRSKRGLALDLKHADGKALFLDLVAESDVLVENFRRGVLERLGLGWDVLKAANPRLVLCSITSQGEAGPDASAASYGSTLEANSGLADLTRDANGAPLISGILLNYPDQIVSIYAAGIVALAIMEQRRTGQGARLDISQRELASFLIGEHILAASAGLPRPKTSTPDLVRDAAGRWALRTPSGRLVPVRNGDDMLTAVLTGETRAAFAKAPDGSDAKGTPYTLSGAPFAVTRRAPHLGQHNAEVLREVLRLGETDIATLTARGLIGTVPKGV